MRRWTVKELKRLIKKAHDGLRFYLFLAANFLAYQWNRRFRGWNTLILLGIAVVMTSSRFFFTLFILMRVDYIDPKIYNVMGCSIFVLTALFFEEEDAEPWNCDFRVKRLRKNEAIRHI